MRQLIPATFSFRNFFNFRVDLQLACSITINKYRKWRASVIDVNENVWKKIKFYFKKKETKTEETTNVSIIAVNHFNKLNFQTSRGNPKMVAWKNYAFVSVSPFIFQLKLWLKKNNSCFWKMYLKASVKLLNLNKKGLFWVPFNG